MFEVVDALNQQIPLGVPPVQLHILTKLAELPLNPYDPRTKITDERFKAMTHIVDSRTIDGHIKALVSSGYLEVKEPEMSAGKARLPLKEYKIILPKGFNAEAVAKWRMKMYGGIPYKSDYIEKFYSPDINDSTVSYDEARLAQEKAEFATKDANLASGNAKITTVNKDNNVNVLNVTNDEVVKVFVEISALTKERPVTRVARVYKHIITGADDAKAARRALDLVKKVLEEKPETIRDIRKYTCDAIKREIAADKLSVSPLEPSHDAPQSATKPALNQYELAAERTKVEIQKQADEAREIAKNQLEEENAKKAYFEKKMPEVAEWPSVLELSEDKRESYLEAFKSMFYAKWNYADLIATFETELKSAVNVKIIDFTREFASKRNNLIFDFPDPA